MASPDGDHRPRARVRLRSGSSWDAAAAVLSSLAMVDWVRRLAGTTTNGDFEALVLWCQLAAQRARGSTCRAGQRPGAPVPVRLPQLVASTGVPRETARRKLELLAALGRVARVDKGWVARPEGMNTLSRAITSKDRRRLREVLAGLEADRRAT